MKKILVPCDFSKTSVEAFKFAVELAKAIQGKIVVLHVIYVPVQYDTTFVGQPYIFDSALYDAITAASEKKFNTLIRKHARGFPKVSFATEHGAVTPMIREYMRAYKPDVVVMGTHGAGGMKEFFIGSNTEKIVRFSKAPVFSIKKQMNFSTIKNIIFPVSQSLKQSDVILKIKELQHLLGARLHILHVNTPFEFISKKELQAYARLHKFSNYTVNIRTNPYEQDGIIAFAGEKHRVMIAMATHARKGLSHLLHGSIAEDLVNHIQCPIWTLAVKRS